MGEKYFEDKVVVILGAAGGLGTAYAKAFAKKGARLVLAGRNPGKLDTSIYKNDSQVSICAADLTDPDSLTELCNFAVKTYKKVDVVVNATGFDVRKPFIDHTLEEIRHSTDINLNGTIFLTHAFLPQLLKQGSGTIVHPGGFADGRLAFPYYAVDVATRAGMFSFIESLNREIKSSGVKLLYFCPTAADTKAEKPFQKMWKELWVKTVPPQRVANELLESIAKKRNVYIMGGLMTAIAAKINLLCPKTADFLFMNRYRKILKKYLG